MKKEKTFEQIVEEIKGRPILVANRGIPARRIARSIRESFEAIPIITATDVDRTSPANSAAQELILLGNNPRAYLDIDLIIRKARERGVIAIHPGWGFAAEDDSFPEKCKAAGIIFIGPDTAAMGQLGNKVKARTLAESMGIPTIPGSKGAVTVEQACETADAIGYPVMLKAEGGGGGRGISEVRNESELASAYEKASAMARAAFGNPRLYVEKLLTSIRHIEIQVAADRYGNVVALDERDCTVQRNHQKLIEITPSPWPKMTPELRENLKTWAAQLIRQVGYYSLATVEFLVDADGRPYLVEVNTRLQVEHGITECRYGIDLVEEQIAVAFGAKLRLVPDQRALNHAMQVRINCEDPRIGFAPNSGKITHYISSGGQGVRVDSCVSGNYDFPSDYDSAAALLMAYGASFEKVLGIMDRALGEYIIQGLKTTIPFHRQVIRHERFRQGEYDTRFLMETPELVNYREELPRYVRNSRLVAEISAKGYNPFVQLGEYRGRADKRLGRFHPVLPEIAPGHRQKNSYPRWDRKALLDQVRDSDHIHFTDTTCRDITQSNSGNRFRLAEDRLIGPYLDQCGFFSLENGGGAHFHVAMLANMTYPFTEAEEWNRFAPETPKQILIRSTNVLGYKPQPVNLMQLTGEMICAHYDIIRCFDFLNHIENMRPFAQVALASPRNVFEPAVSLSWAKGFDVPHYVSVVSEIIDMIKDIAGVGALEASRMIILGLKDMAGVCPPRFIRALIAEIRKTWPELIICYHRHFTDGLFVPAVAAAAEAGAKIVDTGLGAAVRWYGQGEVLSTAAYMEGECGLRTCLDKDMIRKANFVLKQIMPYYDRYTAPYFRGVDYDVVEHGMPGGATSSSQEGALKQGYIHLLPHMLRFLAGTRRIVRYHDVTPGSQITWNTAFLSITSAYKRGGMKSVEELLAVLDAVIHTPESELDDDAKTARLQLYADSNDAFKNLLMGKFGRLPLGFPPDWVYHSAFGAEAPAAIAQRTMASPLDSLPPVDLEAEKQLLGKTIGREPTPEEFVIYLNHPADAVKTIEFFKTYGNANQLPLDVWFEGLDVGEKLWFKDGFGKPHEMEILDISLPDDNGMCTVWYTLDHEFFHHQVKVAAPTGTAQDKGIEMADPNNPWHIAAPSNGDLWVMHVGPGSRVREGEEVCNIAIMKQEKALTAPRDGMVKRVLKTADYAKDRKMVGVKMGELLVELAPPMAACSACGNQLSAENFRFCPHCGVKMT
jgi:pyruvate carboxylase